MVAGYPLVTEKNSDLGPGVCTPCKKILRAPVVPAVSAVESMRDRDYSRVHSVLEKSLKMLEFGIKTPRPLKVEVCMGMGKTGIPWVPWDSHGNGSKISHGMGMGIKCMGMGVKTWELEKNAAYCN